MTINYQTVREQVHELGESALAREQELLTLIERAQELLQENAGQLERLRHKVGLAVAVDATLRCALPVDEPLDACFAAPPLVEDAVIIAADGSQIAPDRNAPVHYGLINVGALEMRPFAADPPYITVESKLYYGDTLATPTGELTEAQLFLKRDLEERQVLVRLAHKHGGPKLTFTDGPVELWGAKDPENAGSFQQTLRDYHASLRELRGLGAAVGGYVDKPAAPLVVRLLEIASIQENDLPQIRKLFPLRGVSDLDLYQRILAPGDRSAIFALQSGSTELYRDELALHFFYLNVGRPGYPWLARVEIPGWVAEDPAQLNLLQAGLIAQCRLMGARPYPYLLHRAHEVARVSLAEHEQVTEMIMHELRQRGAVVGQMSNKQFAKALAGPARRR